MTPRSVLDLLLEGVKLILKSAVKCRVVESVYHTPETRITLHVNCLSVPKIFKKRNKFYICNFHINKAVQYIYR